jgi:hypothetical protein
VTFDEAMALTRRVSSATAFSDAECEKLYELCMEQPSLATVVEIGCQLGRTSSIILQCAKAKGYHSIHIDPYTFQFEYLNGWIKMMHALGHPFVFLCMRTDQARRELAFLCRDGIDLLLIDGDHTTDGVQKDCQFAAERVRPGGLLLCHDYHQQSWPEVHQVLDAYAVPPKWQHVCTYDTLGVWKRQ